MKIGTIALLVLGIVVVNPVIQMPLVNAVGAGTIAVDGEAIPAVVRGSLFPFVFITIACGAISGFHALIASGTTPKMIDKESDMPADRLRGDADGGAGRHHGAAWPRTALPPADYFAINTDPKVARGGRREGRAGAVAGGSGARSIR